ncbi:hypothetical protein JOQ06_028796, partial [Pogonophryne albipinna]
QQEDISMALSSQTQSAWCSDRSLNPVHLRRADWGDFPLFEGEKLCLDEHSRKAHTPFWEWRQPPTSLRTAGLKGESHVRLNLRLDQKECDLGSGRQQSLSAQQRGFGGEDPRQQIAS